MNHEGEKGKKKKKDDEMKNKGKIEFYFLTSIIN